MIIVFALFALAFIFSLTSALALFTKEKQPKKRKIGAVLNAIISILFCSIAFFELARIEALHVHMIEINDLVLVYCFLKGAALSIIFFVLSKIFWNRLERNYGFR